MTLVEAVISVLLVSTVFIAAMQALSASGTVRFKSAERARAQAFAAALLDEVLQQDYAPPSSTSSDDGGLTLLGLITIGGSDGSSSTSTSTSGPGRMGFDDVDDYHNYSDSPPTNRDGTAIPASSGYARRVRVRQVESRNLGQTTSDDTGVKLVTVTVTRNGRTLATRAAVRSNVP